MMANVRQEFTRRPFMCTVHAPHWPWSQPFFVPGSWRFSRSASRRVTRGSNATWWSFPLILSTIGTAPGTSAPGIASVAGSGSCTGAEWSNGAVVTARLAVPSCVRKERLVKRSDVSDCLGCSSSAISIIDLSFFAMVEPNKRLGLKTRYIRLDAFGAFRGASYFRQKDKRYREYLRAEGISRYLRDWPTQTLQAETRILECPIAVNSNAPSAWHGGLQV